MIETITLYDANQTLTTIAPQERNIGIIVYDKINIVIVSGNTIRLTVISGNEKQVIYYNGRFFARFCKETVPFDAQAEAEGVKVTQ